MVAVRLSTTKPDFSGLRREAERLKKLHDRAARDVTDIAIQKAHRHLQAKMRSVGLGRLDRAVGWTSAKRKAQRDKTPYGVIYAKGGDDSLAGGALEAYSRGTTIAAKHFFWGRNGPWLAITAPAAPKYVSVGGKRRRLTPGLWRRTGMDARIGELKFVQLTPSKALLVVRNVSISPKTGQAKRLGARAPRTRIVAKGNTVVFILIRVTRRARRFDKDEIIGFYARRVPDYMARTLEGYQRGAR